MASIGSLTADLRLESATFIRDLNRASQAVAQNTSKMQRSVAAMQAGFARAAATFKSTIGAFVSVAAVRQLASLGKVAIDSADSIAKQARAIGVAADEFQAMRFAGRLAGVEISQLDTAIGLFVKNLGQAKVGTGAFYNALKQTSPALLEQLRNTTDVGEAMSLFLKALGETETATERARIAASAFGKQWQVASKLIAEGSEAFEANKRRARELGLVLETDILAKAELLSDQFDELSTAISVGFQRGFIDSFIGGLTATDDALRSINKSAEEFGRVVGGAFKFAHDFAVSFLGTIETINRELKPVSDFLNFWAGIKPAAEDLLPELSFEQMTADLNKAQSALDPYVGSVENAAAAQRAAAEAQRAWLQGLQEAAPVYNATRTPLEALRHELIDLQDLYDRSLISAETFGRAQTQAAFAALGPWLNVADTIGGALGQIFKENKIVAVAQAVINTAQAITATFAQYGFTPIGIAAAAAQAAAGAAQIAAIKSTSPGTSKSPKVSGGGGSSAPAAATAAASGPSSEHALHLTLVGEGFSQKQIRDLIDEFNIALGNGAHLNVTAR